MFKRVRKVRFILNKIILLIFSCTVFIPIFLAYSSDVRINFDHEASIITNLIFDSNYLDLYTSLELDSITVAKIRSLTEQDRDHLFLLLESASKIHWNGNRDYNGNLIFKRYDENGVEMYSQSPDFQEKFEQPINNELTVALDSFEQSGTLTPDERSSAKFVFLGSSLQNYFLGSTRGERISLQGPSLTENLPPGDNYEYFEVSLLPLSRSALKNSEQSVEYLYDNLEEALRANRPIVFVDSYLNGFTFYSVVSLTLAIASELSSNSKIVFIGFNERSGRSSIDFDDYSINKKFIEDLIQRKLNRILNSNRTPKLAKELLKRIIQMSDRIIRIIQTDLKARYAFESVYLHLVNPADIYITLSNPIRWNLKSAESFFRTTDGYLLPVHLPVLNVIERLKAMKRASPNDLKLSFNQSLRDGVAIYSNRIDLGGSEDMDHLLEFIIQRTQAILLHHSQITRTQNKQNLKNICSKFLNQ